MGQSQEAGFILAQSRRGHGVMHRERSATWFKPMLALRFMLRFFSTLARSASRRASTDDLFAMELLYDYEAKGRCKLLGSESWNTQMLEKIRHVNVTG